MLERVSIGGMAEIYRAKPFDTPAFDRFLAVKRILPNLADDREFIEMFVEEAKIAIQLNHPNVCQNYELGRVGSTPYIVMEYIAGQNILAIHKRLREHKRITHYIPAAFISRAIALALDHAHSKCDEDGQPLGIVHRDVSPQNIIISYGGEAKLVDFGIAKVRGSRTQTQVGVLKGKFGYMSPEQVNAQPVDHRSDLFALGIVFHEMLTGKRLFHGKTDFDTLEKIRQLQVRPPEALNNDIPPDLSEIVMTCLAREPHQRFQSGKEMADALGSFLSNTGYEFDQPQLSEWMMHFFAKELAEERERRGLFKMFVTPEDVRSYNAEQIVRYRQRAGAPEVDEGEPRVSSHELARMVSEDERVVRTPERGIVTGTSQLNEVIAVNRFDALSDLISRHRDAVLANVDLPEPHEPEPIYEFFSPPIPKRGQWPLFVAALLGFVLAGLIAIVIVLRTSQPALDLEPGWVVIESEPADDLQIFVSGRWAGDSTPLTVRDLRPGSVTLEIRHPDYSTYASSFRVESGRPVHLNAVLEPLPEGPAFIDLRISRPASVWIDGELVSAEDRAPAITVTGGRAEYLVEVLSPGHFVVEERVRLNPGQRISLEVNLVPNSATLLVQSSPGGLVYINDIEFGSTVGGELRITELAPFRPMVLRIEPTQRGFLPYETTLLFETMLERSMFPRLRRIGEAPPPTEAGIGTLSLDTGDSWYLLVLDGDDTGLTTPISAPEAIHLWEGEREISLVRGDEAAVIGVTIRGGEHSHIDCSESVWDCRY